MKTIKCLFPKFMIGIGFILIQSNCTVVEMINTGKVNRMGAGAPEVNDKGKFSDSPYNRQRFRENVDARIIKEKNDMVLGYDWERSWRSSIQAINQSSENPDYKKKYIITKRKQAGLPIWPFMLN
jgi:hypothetical protein